MSTNQIALRPAKGAWLKRPALFGALALFMAGSFALAAPAMAQLAPAKSAATEATKKTVSVALAQFKVGVDAAGKEKLEDAVSVKPGDVIEYRATYTNNTGKSVSGLVANLPIPEGLEYLPRSAKPAASVKAATKDGVFAAEPLMRKSAEGKSEPVPYNEYRSLRWTLGQLAAGGSTVVSARARVEVNSASTPSAAATSAARAAGGAVMAQSVVRK